MRRRGVVIAAIVVCVPVVFALGGCKKKGTASVTCGALEAFESRLGTLNVPQVALGEILWVNRDKKTGGMLGRVIFGEGDVTLHTPSDHLSVAYDSKLSITFSANVPAAAKATLESAISKSTELVVDNFQRRTLFRVIDLLNGDQAAKSLIENHLHANPKDEIHVVFAVVEAKSLSFSVAGASSTGANVSTLAYGDYELRVSYNCQNVLGWTGPASPVFFKSAPVGFDGHQGSFYFDSSVDSSLRDIDLRAAFM
jgi:hypothetical protein